MEEIKRQGLARCLLFAELPEEQLAWVAEIARVRRYGRQEAVFFEGDGADGFYLVAEGRVKVFKQSAEGREQILHILGPGEVFGEVPVLHGSPRFPANATCLEKSVLLFIPRQGFVELVQDHPSLALRMLAILALRLRRFTAQVEALSLQEVPARLAGHLLYLRDEQGGRRIDLTIPKGQLASLLGTTPETLSRIFARMSESGAIRVQGRIVTIEDEERLLEFARR